MHENYKSYALNNPMKYTDPTGYIPYEFQREAYFNWMTHRDINYAHDGVYYGDGFYKQTGYGKLYSMMGGGNGGKSNSYYSNKNIVWGMINAAWNTAMANGYSYSSFDYSNGTLISSAFGEMGNLHFSEIRQQYGYFVDYTIAYTHSSLENRGVAGVVVAYSKWYAVNINDAQSSGGGWNAANTASHAEDNGIDKYFTGLGAMETITDFKNATLEYVGKTSKLVAAESKYLRYSKGLGTLAGVAGTAYSGYKVGNAISNNQKVDLCDVADVSVGVLGTTATLLLPASASNPVGWTILGGIAIGSTIYGGVRVGMELYDIYKNP